MSDKYISKNDLTEWLNTCLNSIHCTDEEGATLDLVLDHVEWIDEFDFGSRIADLEARLADSVVSDKDLMKIVDFIHDSILDDCLDLDDALNEVFKLSVNPGILRQALEGK